MMFAKAIFTSAVITGSFAATDAGRSDPELMEKAKWEIAGITCRALEADPDPELAGRMLKKGLVILGNALKEGKIREKMEGFHIDNLTERFFKYNMITNKIRFKGGSSNEKKFTLCKKEKIQQETVMTSDGKTYETLVIPVLKNSKVQLLRVVLQSKACAQKFIQRILQMWRYQDDTNKKTTRCPSVAAKPKDTEGFLGVDTSKFIEVEDRCHTPELGWAICRQIGEIPPSEIPPADLCAPRQFFINLKTKQICWPGRQNGNWTLKSVRPVAFALNNYNGFPSWDFELPDMMYLKLLFRSEEDRKQFGYNMVSNLMWDEWHVAQAADAEEKMNFVVKPPENIMMSMDDIVNEINVRMFNGNGHVEASNSLQTPSKPASSRRRRRRMLERLYSEDLN